MNNREIGQIIRQKRLEHGLTQEQLAQKIGIVRGSLQQIESGRRKPGAEVTVKLCEVLDMSPEELGAEYKAANFARQVENVTRSLTDKKNRRALNISKILEYLNLLTDEELPEVIRFMKDLMRKNGGVRHYENIFNADVKTDPNAEYEFRDSD